MTESAGKPSGLATLDSSGKLVQMPTAADVGASYNSATIVLADTSQPYDLNDYWTPGQLVYVSQSVIDNESIANCPSTTGGLLEVIGSSQNLIIQQYTAVGDGLLYTRHKAITSGNISGWGGVNGIRTETNSNGTYVKYPDGTMICFGIVTLTPTAANVATTLYITLPAQATGEPAISLTPRVPDPKTVSLSYGVPTGKGYQIIATRTDSANAYPISWIAFGRWK